jgi:hypothetical protein
MTNRSAPPTFTWVLGIPSGGTSATAGVLSRLGVPMGSVSPALGAWGRKYSLYECSRAMSAMSQFQPWARETPLVDAKTAADVCGEYVRNRRTEHPEGPIGAKAWVNFAATHPSFWSSSVRGLFVQRDLEETLRSFDRYNQNNPSRTEIGATREAAYIAGLWHNQQKALEVAPPDQVFGFHYEMLNAVPESVVPEIADWLGITDTTKIMRAVDFIVNYDGRQRETMNA